MAINRKRKVFFLLWSLQHPPKIQTNVPTSNLFPSPFQDTCSKIGIRNIRHFALKKKIIFANTQHKAHIPQPITIPISTGIRSEFQSLTKGEMLSIRVEVHEYELKKIMFFFPDQKMYFQNGKSLGIATHLRSESFLKWEMRKFAFFTENSTLQMIYF